MGEHVVVEAVGGEEIGGEVGVVVRPVLGELLRAQHENGLVAQLVVLDDRQCGERLPEANGVGEDAAVVGLQLVDDARGRVPLEVVQTLPDLRLLVTGAVVRQHVLVDVVEKLREQVVEDQEVDPCRRVLRVDGGDVIMHGVSDIAHLLGIVPNLIEQLQVLLGHRRFIEPVYEARHRVAAFIPEVGGREPLQLCVGGFVVDHGELLHRVASRVRPERHLAANPVRALWGYPQIVDTSRLRGFVLG